jgi:uncharacterized protein YdiU (UPF0061 family)
LTWRRLADAVPAGGTNPSSAANPSSALGSSSAAASSRAGDAAVRELFAEPAAFDAWALRWGARLGRDAPMPAVARAAAMRRVNPARIPRNHWVERAIVAATSAGDFTVFEGLLAALGRPYETLPGHEQYEQPSSPEERVTRTFCGT